MAVRGIRAPRGANVQVCRHFARRACTGCTALHRDYATQLTAKTGFVRDALASAGLSGTVDLRPIVPSPAPLGYRSSVKLCLNEDRDGHRTIGLYRAGSKQVTSTQGCPAQTSAVNAMIERLTGKSVRPPARFYDHGGRVFQRGRIKYLLIRSAAPAGGSGIVIAHTGVDPDDLRRWVKPLAAAGVSFYETRLTASDGDQLLGRGCLHLCGPLTFDYPLAGQVHHLTPMAFFQANLALCDQLIGLATAFNGGGELLLDLYGGFGAYSAAVASQFRSLRLVDANRDAIAAVTHGPLAAHGDLRAHAMTCEAYFKDSSAKGDWGRASHLIVNPPRSGLSRDVVRHLTLTLSGARALNYVSCNPATLGRDLAALGVAGWRLGDLTPVDMFPQTDHVEVVARLTR